MDDATFRRLAIIGPFRHPSPAQMAAHVLTAQAAAVDAINKGWIVYCPHTALGWAYERITESDATRINDYFLRQSDAALLLPGWGNSEGSRRELSLAKKDGLVIFRSSAEVPAWE